MKTATLDIDKMSKVILEARLLQLWDYIDHTQTNHKEREAIVDEVISIRAIAREKKYTFSPEIEGRF